MPYDKRAIQQAKDKGILQDGVFDAKALGMDEQEKERLKSELQKVKPQEDPESPPSAPASPPAQDAPQKAQTTLQLSFWDRVVLFFLALLGVQAQESYLQYRALRDVYKQLAFVRPAIFNEKTRTATRYLAYRVLDLQMKLLFFKPVFEIMETPMWDSVHQQATGIERLFEYMMGVDRAQLNDLLGYEGILNRFRTNLSSQTITVIRQDMEQYLAAVSQEKREEVNRHYTFLMYLKNLVFYEFEWLLKRFDSSYSVTQEAHFGEVPVEALLSYFVTLEEALFQIDLHQDFHTPLQALFAVYQEVKMGQQEEKKEDEVGQAMQNTFYAQIDALKRTLEEFMYKNYLTLLIRAGKRNPSYMPSFVHIRFDLVKKYTEIAGKHLKSMIDRAMKQVRFETVEKNIHAYFPQLKSVGVYAVDRSKDLEQMGLPAFTHSYALAILAHFFDVYYKTWMQPILNVVLMNGVFADEYFKRSISDTFYGVDKFQTKLQEFVAEIQPAGGMGVKFLGALKRHEGADGKKNLEKHIISLNSVAGDLFREFYTHFLSLRDIIMKLVEESQAVSPRYLRNAHSIGAKKHTPYREDLKKTQEFLRSFESILLILREMPS